MSLILPPIIGTRLFKLVRIDGIFVSLVNSNILVTIPVPRPIHYYYYYVFDLPNILDIRYIIPLP